MIKTPTIARVTTHINHEAIFPGVALTLTQAAERVRVSLQSAYPDAVIEVVEHDTCGTTPSTKLVFVQGIEVPYEVEGKVRYGVDHLVELAILAAHEDAE